VASDRAGGRAGLGHGNAATVRYNLASLHDGAGEWAAAGRLLEEAHARYLRAHDARGAADCRAALASIEIARGNPARARELHEEAARMFRAGGYRRRLLDSLVDLAAIARDEGRFADGERLPAEASRLGTETGDPLELHDVELHLGDLYFTAGDEAAARSHYGRSAEIIRDERERLTREDEALSFFGADRTENIDRLITLSSGDPPGCVTWIERAKGQELLRRLDSTAIPHAPSWPDMRHLLERLASADPARGVLFVHYYTRDSVTVVAGLRPGRDPVLAAVEISLAELRAATADPRHGDWPATSCSAWSGPRCRPGRARCWPACGRWTSCPPDCCCSTSTSGCSAGREGRTPCAPPSGGCGTLRSPTCWPTSTGPGNGWRAIPRRWRRRA
jgi:tetratricopeptide (TPR) repeat protein